LFDWIDTPVEKHGNIGFKREDLFELGGMYGAKVRACLALCKDAQDNGFTHVVSSGFRYSPQLAVMGTVAKHLGLKAIGVTTRGESLPFIQQAENLGVEIHRVACGYSNVLQARARSLAEDYHAYVVPFSMKDELSISLTAESLVRSFRNTHLVGMLNRIVVVAGSGVNLAGILTGLHTLKADNMSVLAVMVGADCRKFVYRSCSWDNCLSNVTFVKSGQDYNELSTYNQVNGVVVDSRYEGKAIPYLQPGDLFWLIGKAVTTPVLVSREV
jgi:1-aminocyclopropane-1-carboxylate deaminase/D-cysteine desulfhydrase-like pyridoxal-dependent ACC family enzyme